MLSCGKEQNMFIEKYKNESTSMGEELKTENERISSVIRSIEIMQFNFQKLYQLVEVLETQYSDIYKEDKLRTDFHNITLVIKGIKLELNKTCKDCQELKSYCNRRKLVILGRIRKQMIRRQ